ncbi:MAG: FecR domain-containing protein [Spirochaetales bacterium]|nr:FecR domain-containing protein [Spirochaetales bacterium]
MHKFFSYIMIIAFILVPVGLFSQAQIVTLEYFSGGDILINADDGEVLESVDLYEGMQIKTGWRISTGQDGTAELKMKPNGTIIKLASSTTFTVKALDTGTGKRQNEFEILTGKFRAVAQKFTGGGEDYYYRFTSPSAICGVRGTDFGMEVSEGKEIAFTLTGLIDFINASGSTIAIGAGQMANALASTFQSFTIPGDYMNSINDSLSFLKAQAEGSVSQPTPTPETTTGPEIPEGEQKTQAPVDPWLQKLLKMEIGSVTIDNTTYGKVVMQPEIDLDFMKIGFYLPIIYTTDMFNPDTWYHPDGNNEWSFGTDPAFGEDYTLRAADFFSDLFLKIKYFQLGKQRDPYFIKLGSLKTFTIGHGLLMENYANDADFPAIRRLGINLGINTDQFGFEIMTNDLLQVLDQKPRIVGTRIVLKPFAPASAFGFGISAVADFNPGQDLPSVSAGPPLPPTADEIGNPMFFNLGFDLDIPILPEDPLSIILFADIGAMLPWFQTDGSGAYSSIKAGPAYTAVWSDGSQMPLRNYGFSTGIFGKLFILDYRFDFRYYTGTFKHAFFDRSYDRTAAETAVAVADYMLDPTNPEYDKTLMGLYFEAGYTWEEFFSINIGYMQPLTLDATGQMSLDGEDSFRITAKLEKDALPPIVPVYGSISYERSYFVPMLLGQQPTGKALSFWDQYSVLQGELVYSFSPNMDLAILLTNAIAKDAAGEVIYDGSGNPKMDITFSLETRVHF